MENKNNVCSVDSTGKLQCITPKTDYRKLFNLQDKLIEHRYKPEGVWELILSHSGDIFRGLSKDTPDARYVEEKLMRLGRYMGEDPGFELNHADFEIFSKYVNGLTEWYTPDVITKNHDNYRRNLKTLRDETEKEVIDPVRRECMLNALDMMGALTSYYESGSPNSIPKAEFRRLKRSVNTCLTGI